MRTQLETGTRRDRRERFVLSAAVIAAFFFGAAFADAQAAGCGDPALQFPYPGVLNFCC